MELTDERYLQVFERVGKNDTQNVFTPPRLIRRMLNRIDFTSNCKVLVWYNVEFLIYLVKEVGLSPKNIYIYTNTQDKLILEKQGYNVVYQENINFDKIAHKFNKMKFNVIIGNPPYTQGQKLLYVKFFELSLDMSDLVLMIMPHNLNSRHDKLKFHNLRVKKHSVYISDNQVEYFGVGYNDIRTIIADKTIINNIEPLPDKFENYEMLMPDRNRLKTIKGCTSLANQNCVSDDGRIVVHKVKPNNCVEFRTVNNEAYDRSRKKSTAPFLLFVNHTPSKGKFNTYIHENNGEIAWGMWTFAFECYSNEEANNLKNWIESQTIVDEVNRLLSINKGQYTISKKMIEMLPYYE